jgi:hypothetical protein
MTLKRQNFSEVYSHIKFHNPSGRIGYVTPDSEFRRTATLVLFLRRDLEFIKAHRHRGNCK